MQRTGYGVVTSVAVTLCVIGLATKLLQPTIPLPKENRLRTERDEYLRQARYQAVDWRPFTRKTLIDAAHLDRPVLLVIGVPSSHLAQLFDKNLMTEPDIAMFLQRSFTCIRVDGAAHPEWLNAFLPFTRLSDHFQPDFQIWFLDRQGRPYDFLGRQSGIEDFSSTNLLPLLIKIQSKYSDLANGGRVIDANAQRNDIERLATQTGSAPVPFGAYTESIHSIALKAFGGFPVDKYTPLAPQVWRYLVITGDSYLRFHAIDGLLHSPFLDLMDGGFFHTQVWADGRTIETNKETVENANAMLALAESDAISPNDLENHVAKETWHFLESCLHGSSGFVQGQLGDQEFLMRSPRYSVSARRLRDSMPPELQEWARSSLGLDVVRYPQAIPFFESATFDDPRTVTAMNLLRATAPLAVMVESGLADDSLTSVARAIETARLMRDGQHVAKALEWLARLETLHTRDDVLARVNGGSRHGYLGAYLAYADARLQAYLAGDATSFQPGLQVLRRARKLFAGDRPGVFLLTRPSPVFVLPDTTVPEIADNLHESCTARMIRLLLAYGRLLGSTAEGQEFQTEARAAIRVFAPIAVDGGVATAGFFCAAAEAADDAFAVTVGPRSIETANDLAAELPARLVAPVSGMVMPELAHKPPGVYLVHLRGQQGPLGPFTVTEARSRLKPILDVGLGDRS